MVPRETWAMAKQYCEMHGYIINKWVSRLIKQEASSSLQYHDKE